MRSATKNHTGRDPAYLKFIRSLPCAVCPLGRQWTITEAAHTGPHGLSQKSDDHTAIPLCAGHHREGRFSLHTLGKEFWRHYQVEREELIRELRLLYAQAKHLAASPSTLSPQGTTKKE